MVPDRLRMVVRMFLVAVSPFCGINRNRSRPSWPDRRFAFPPPCVMTKEELNRKKMTMDRVIDAIADSLALGTPSDPPAYTLILGAGASFGAVPTAKQMLGLPDAKTKEVHPQCIPLWRAKRDSAVQLNAAGKAPLDIVKEFWASFTEKNPAFKDLKFDDDGLPAGDSEAVAAAYKAVFDTQCVGGLGTPKLHCDYLRATTLPTKGESTHLNATHFYLASLLALQNRDGDKGVKGERLYKGSRPFARTLFTTNFDPLLQTSLQLFQILYYMTDRPEVLAADGLQTDDHPAIHLFYAHGSVHRPHMANTDAQIAELKKKNADSLSGYLGNHGVIVLGYSGWDDCLLAALTQCHSFSNNLYWLARGEDSLGDAVKTFLSGHSNAYWADIDDGGAFMARLHGRLCPGAPNTELLYNPIHLLLQQLRCISLTGIQSGGEAPLSSSVSLGMEKKATRAPSGLDSPRDVDDVRTKVVQFLEAAQKTLLDASVPPAPWVELEHQADLCYANQDYKGAVDAYDKLLKLPGDLPVENRARALFRRGYVQSSLKKWDSAIEDYTEAIKLPNAPKERVARALYNRGLAYGVLGKSKEEIADYTAVIKMNGAPAEEKADAYFNRGVEHSNNGRYEKAKTDFAAILKLQGAPKTTVASAKRHLQEQSLAEAKKPRRILKQKPLTSNRVMKRKPMRRK